MGIGKRLSTSTADLVAALPASELERNGEEKAVLARTAPGQLLAIHSGMSALQNEVLVLQERLRKFDGGLVTRQIDPTAIRPSRWANRHEASFATPAFASLKASIALAGGNAQPILVREHLPDQFEIVFGHRRHRACLELGIPVLAVVAEQSLGDIEVFLSMEQENRERADLSPFRTRTELRLGAGVGPLPVPTPARRSRGRQPHLGAQVHAGGTAAGAGPSGVQIALGNSTQARGGDRRGVGEGPRLGAEKGGEASTR